MAHFSGPGSQNMGFTIPPGLLVRCAARCVATDYCQSYSVLPDGSCVFSDICIGDNHWVVRPWRSRTSWFYYLMYCIVFNPWQGGILSSERIQMQCPLHCLSLGMNSLWSAFCSSRIITRQWQSGRKHGERTLISATPVLEPCVWSPTIKPWRKSDRSPPLCVSYREPCAGHPRCGPRNPQ